MRLWLTEMLSDFCRWRARCASRRVGRDMASLRGWLEREKQIIHKLGNIP